MAYHCIACNSQRTSCVGSLPVFTPDFLGKPRGSQVDSGSLYRCLDCTLRFRVPTPSEEELANYYRGLASDELWQHEPDREIWRETKKVIASAPERTILDVGCFRGDLLNYLGSEWQRFGVEPSRDARSVAESRGISIIGESLESLPDNGQQFGVVTVVDVMEHLRRPFDSLSKLASLIKPGGQLVIFTGNTDAWSWRLAGLHYWYSALPEHVAFFSPKWFSWAAPRINCRITRVKRFRYQPAPFRTRLDETVKNIAYATYRHLANATTSPRVISRLPVLSRIATWESCWWTSARDHMLVVLTKDS